MGQPSRLIYLTHMTVGHYGIFSLTPIWLLVPIGLSGALLRRGPRQTVISKDAVAEPPQATSSADTNDQGRSNVDKSMRDAEPTTQSTQHSQSLYRLVLAAIGLATIVCGVFYIMRPEIDRNYGGVSICFRWMLWFSPLWLFASAGPAEWLVRRKWGRIVLIVLLAASVFSVSTSLSGPWQPPWLYRFWSFLGWIDA